MKNNDKNSNEPSAKRSYKKRYLLRVYEEKEAEKEIVLFEPVEDVPQLTLDTPKGN